MRVYGLVSAVVIRLSIEQYLETLNVVDAVVSPPLKRD
jgi:hypothetical protein